MLEIPYCERLGRRVSPRAHDDRCYKCIYYKPRIYKFKD